MHGALRADGKGLGPPLPVAVPVFDESEQSVARAVSQSKRRLRRAGFLYLDHQDGGVRRRARLRPGPDRLEQSGVKEPLQVPLHHVDVEDGTGFRFPHIARRHGGLSLAKPLKADRLHEPFGDPHTQPGLIGPFGRQDAQVGHAGQDEPFICVELLHGARTFAHLHEVEDVAGGDPQGTADLVGAHRRVAFDDSLGDDGVFGHQEDDHHPARFRLGAD